MEKKRLFIKMLIVFASFFMLFILSNSNVFAAESGTITFHDSILNKDVKVILPSDIPDGFTYRAVSVQKIVDKSSGVVFSNYSIYFASHPFVSDIVDGNLLFYLDVPAGQSFKSVCYDAGALQNSSTSFKSVLDCSTYNFSKFYVRDTLYVGIVGARDDVDVLYTNHDIVDKATRETVFQKAKEPSQLTTIAQSMDFLAVIKEVLGILPTILAILIGLLSLRKAIQLMLKMLHQA